VIISSASRRAWPPPRISFIMRSPTTWFASTASLIREFEHPPTPKSPHCQLLPCSIDPQGNPRRPLRVPAFAAPSRTEDICSCQVKSRRNRLKKLLLQFLPPNNYYLANLKKKVSETSLCYWNGDASGVSPKSVAVCSIEDDGGGLVMKNV
jgi:hypothetical protein